jgi:hypothetical protein
VSELQCCAGFLPRRSFRGKANDGDGRQRDTRRMTMATDDAADDNATNDADDRR